MFFMISRRIPMLVSRFPCIIATPNIKKSDTGIVLAAYHEIIHGPLCCKTLYVSLVEELAFKRGGTTRVRVQISFRVTSLTIATVLTSNRGQIWVNYADEYRGTKTMVKDITIKFIWISFLGVCLCRLLKQWKHKCSKIGTCILRDPNRFNSIPVCKCSLPSECWYAHLETHDAFIINYSQMNIGI